MNADINRGIQRPFFRIPAKLQALPVLVFALLLSASLPVFASGGTDVPAESRKEDHTEDKAPDTADHTENSVPDRPDSDVEENASGDSSADGTGSEETAGENDADPDSDPGGEASGGNTPDDEKPGSTDDSASGGSENDSSDKKAPGSDRDSEKDPEKAADPEKDLPEDTTEPPEEEDAPLEEESVSDMQAAVPSEKPENTGDFFTKDFSEYSVLEGLVLLIFVVVFCRFCMDLTAKVMNWRMY